MSDSSDEEVVIMRKALHVEFPDDFDPNKIPETGEEYLHHVMYEARKCKAWVTADIDRSTFSNKQTFNVELSEGITTAPKSMLPTTEWQQEKVADFSAFRRYIATLITEEPENCAIHNSHWEDVIYTEIPKFSIISKLTQATKHKLLLLIIDYLNTLKNGLSLPHVTSVWLYSILATLEIPLSPAGCHTLRQLARKCSLIRSKLPENAPEEMYVSLNLFICLVARYFHQLDLADD